MIYLIICMIIFVIPLPLLLVYRHLDPIYIIARELFLPPLIYWNVYHILGMYTFSFLFCLIGCFVVIKFLFILILVFVVKINHIKTYTNTFLNLLNPNEYELLNFYTMLRIFVILFQHVISELTLYVVVWSEIVLTIMAWLFVNGFSHLPVLILLTTLAGFIGGLVMAICVFKILLYARLNGGELVKRKSHQFHGHDRTRRSYYFTIKWKAQNELRINCGSCFAFSKGALHNYLTVLNTNTTNAVLLVKP